MYRLHKIDLINRTAKVYIKIRSEIIFIKIYKIKIQIVVI